MEYQQSRQYIGILVILCKHIEQGSQCMYIMLCPILLFVWLYQLLNICLLSIILAILCYRRLGILYSILNILILQLLLILCSSLYYAHLSAISLSYLRYLLIINWITDMWNWAAITIAMSMRNQFKILDHNLNLYVWLCI